MAIPEIKSITQSIPKMFSVGFLDDKGKNKTPDWYADACENITIKNQGVTVRKGQQEIYNAELPNAVRGIISNSILSTTRLYYVANSHLRYIDLTDNTTHDIGSIGTDARVRMFNSGKYIIILTGVGYPRSYDGSTLLQSTSTTIPVNTNPSFGTRFAGFTVVNSNLNKNIIYISRPITASTQDYCVDWLGSGAQTIDCQSEVLGFCSTMNSLRVFTSTNIQRLDRNNLATTGGVTSTYTIPFAQSYSGVASPDSIVRAGQAIFFLTPNKKIATINYEGTVTEPQMKTISDVKLQSIDGYMQRELIDDQSSSFGFYNEEKKLVQFWCKSLRTTVPDIVMNYDIENKTFYPYSNKFYSCITTFEKTNQIYAGSSLSHRILQDDIGESDCGDPIDWFFETTDVVLGDAGSVYEFRGVSCGGQINSLASITSTSFVDDNLAVSKNIVGSNYTGIFSMGIGSGSIGSQPIGGYSYGAVDTLVDIEPDIGYESLRYVGKKIKTRYSGGQVGADFILDAYSVTYRPKVRKLRSDKL